MRVLNLGYDPTLFLPVSAARERMRRYATAVEELHILSPAPRGTRGITEEHVFLHPVCVSKWSRIPTLATRAHALILERKIDVVSAQDPLVHGLAALWAVRGTPALLNIQVHTDLAARSWWWRLLARIVLSRAHTVRVVSEKIRRDIAPLLPRTPITVLPIYIDVAPFRALVHHPHPVFKKTILWYGRFEPEKDPERALAILEQVRASGIDAGLILLGTGSLERTLRDAARTRGLEEQVVFPGWSDPKPYLAMADVVISTSRHESYGASIVEALVAGVPVVALDVGIAREAGALIATPQTLGETVGTVLHSKTRGILHIPLYTIDEWTMRWVESLVAGNSPTR